MEEIKFRYSVVKPSGHYIEEIFTLDQIEKGDVKQWIIVNFIIPSDIKKDIFLKTINNYDIFLHDILSIEIQRVSGSYSSWYQKTNKNHKTYRLNFIVYFDNEDLQIKLKIANSDEEKKLKQPIGREKIEQNLNYPISFDKWQYSTHNLSSIYKVGNIWKNPELLKEKK